MSSGQEFGVQSILIDPGFSWVFLVTWIMVIFLSIFTVFYLGRALAFLFSLLVRLLVLRGENVHFHVASLHFSVFSGRIFFKDLVYAGENEAFSVLQGHISWRFWLKRVRRSAFSIESSKTERDPESKSTRKLEELPARAQIHCKGFEWFVYNHSPAFDDLVKQSEVSAPDLAQLASEDTPRWLRELARILPIQFDVENAALIVGNERCESLARVCVKSFSATADIAKSANPQDLCCYVYDFEAHNMVCELLPNLDYSATSVKPPSRLRNFFKKFKSTPGVATVAAAAAAATGNLPTSGKGEDRPFEYAKVSRILETKQLNLRYSYDEPGLSREMAGPDPSYNIDVILTKTVINYGPWAERQRVQLWQMLFPLKCTNNESFILKVGELRKCRKMKVGIDFEGSFIFRVPTREASKKRPTTAPPEGILPPPYGWLEIGAGRGVRAFYTQDAVPRADSTLITTFGCSLPDIEITSSVNQALMLSAKMLSLNGSCLCPEQWNGIQSWDFNFVLQSPRFFFLREHAVLLSDIGIDFSESSVMDSYDLFVPAIYKMDCEISDLTLFFNVNPSNIIDNPISMSKNTFLAFVAPEMTLTSIVPLDQLLPVERVIHIELLAPKIGINLFAPSWHTLQSFLESPNLAAASDFRYSSKMSFGTNVENPIPEIHDIDITGNTVTLIAYGFFVDYLMLWIENYFGSTFHFQTMTEFFEGKRVAPEPSFTRSDADLDCIIRSKVNNIAIILPAYVYSARKSLCIRTAHLDVDCRFTNYYMDLQAAFSPLYGFRKDNVPVADLLRLAETSYDPSLAELTIDCLEIKSHRMFGLPPDEPTYNCRWEIDLGKIGLASDVNILSFLERTSHCFQHTNSDLENKPLIEPVIINDVVFVAVRIAGVEAKVWTSEGHHANVSVSPITMSFNDLSNSHYNGKLELSIPGIYATITVDGNQIFSLETSVEISNFTNSRGGKAKTKAQQDHIALHDSLFHRCGFLLDDSHRHSSQYLNPPPDALRPSITLPKFPPHLTRESALILEPRLNVVPTHHTAAFDNATDTEGYSGTDSSLFGSSSDSGDIQTQSSGASSHYFNAPESKQDAEKLLDDELVDSDDDLNPRSLSDAHPLQSAPGRVRLPWNQHAPHSQVEDDSEVDSLVVELGAVSCTISTEIFEFARSVEDSLEPQSIEALLDELQGRLVEELSLPTLKFMRRIHLVCGQVFVKFGEMYRAQVGSQLTLKDDFVFLRLQSISGKLSVKGEPNDMMQPVDISSEDENLMHINKGIHVDIASFALGIQRGTSKDVSQATPVVVQLNNFGFWSQWSPNQQPATEFSVPNVDLFTSGQSLDWTLEFIWGLYQLSLVAERDAIPKTSNPMASLALLLAEAGEKNAIGDDSYVLSRPSGAVQSTNHVRSTLSWRICVRLRHIYHSLSPRAIEKINNKILLNSHTLPENARERFQEIFKNWRSWERPGDLAGLRCMKIFGRKGKTPGQEVNGNEVTRLLVKIVSLSLRVSYQTGSEDFILFDDLSLQLMTADTPESNKYELVPMCTRIKIKLSLEFVLLMSKLHVVVRKILKESASPNRTPDPQSLRPLSPAPSQQQDAQDHPQQQHKQQQPGIKPSVCHGVIFGKLDDLTLELATESLSLKVQTHFSRVSSAFEIRPDQTSLHFFSCGSIFCGQAAVRLRDEIKACEMGDYLVETFSSGFLFDNNRVILEANVDTFASAFTSNLVEVVSSLTSFMKEDVKPIKQALEQAGLLSDTDSDRAKPSLGTGLFETIHLNFAIRNLHYSALLFSDLSLGVVGSKFNLKVRATKHDEALICTQLERHTLTLKENNHNLLVLAIKNMSILMRGLPKLNAWELMPEIQRVKIETASMIRILDYAQTASFPHAYLEIKTAVKLLMAAYKSLSDESSPAQSSTNLPSVTYNSSVINVTSIIREVSVSLRLDHQAALIISLHHLRGRYDSFTWATELDEPMNKSQYKAERHSSDVSPSLSDSRSSINSGQYRKAFVRILESSTLGSQFKELEIDIVLPTRTLQIVSLQLTASYNSRRAGNSLYITSDFCRLSMSPESAGYTSAVLIKIESDALEILNQLPNESTTDSPALESQPQPAYPDLLVDYLQNLKAAIALSEFSFEWQTDDASNGSEGLIIGFDLLQINISELKARMDLKLFYIIPIESSKQGDISDESDRESEAMNKASLPHVEVVAIVTRTDVDRLIYVRMHGESLDIKLTSEIAPTIAGLLSSLELTTASVSKLPPLPASTTPTPTKSRWDFEADSKPEFTSGYSVHVESKFDETSLRLWQDPVAPYASSFTPQSKEPSLDLRTPTIALKCDFIPEKDRRDEVNVTLDVGQSHNTVYPRALREVTNLWEKTNAILDERRRNRAELSLNWLSSRQSESSVPSVSRPSTPPPPSSVLYRVLSHISFSLALNFNPQHLSLSSAPYSRMNADAFASGISLQLSSLVDAKTQLQYISLVCSLSGGKLSLQHVHSREPSFSLQAKKVIVNVMQNAESIMSEQKPLRTAVRIVSPRMELKAADLPDLVLFKDIWSMESAIASPLVNSSKDVSPEPQDPFTERYYYLVQKVAVAVSANLQVTNLEAKCDFGQALGECNLKVSDVWIALFKTKLIEQSLLGGVREIQLSLGGRLGGCIDVARLKYRLNVFWHGPNELPTLQSTVRISNIAAYISFDYHPFLVVNGDNICLDLVNKRESLGKTSGHRLLVSVSVDKLQIVTTSLVSSLIYDIVSLLKSTSIFRMSNKIGPQSTSNLAPPGMYDFEVNTSATSLVGIDIKPGAHARFKARRLEAARRVIEGLAVSLALQFKSFEVFLFPTDFDDEVAVYFCTYNIAGEFQQAASANGGIQSDLGFTSQRCRLAVVSGDTDKEQHGTLTHLDIPRFLLRLKHFQNVNNIISVPDADICINTTDIKNHKQVFYKFRSVFDGFVEVGWNLGAINFIKEMVDTHNNALNVRLKLEPKTKQDGENNTATEQRPDYIASEPPIILIPQLRDMGEATPPLEWIGVHRKELPMTVHWYIVRTLNEAVGEIEVVYAGLLRRI